MVTITANIANKTEQELQSWLQDRLSPERFQHSLGAKQMALELARRFHSTPVETEKAVIAGLLHDAAKLMSPKQLLAACAEFGIDVPDEERLSPQTLHPFVGAELVKRELRIDDEDVLNAIRFHTTGRPGMSRLEKLVYVADKIEENTRNPLYTQKILKLMTGDSPEILDQAVLYVMDSTITFLIEKHQRIHPRTIEARNELVGQVKQTRQMPITKEDPI